VGMSLIFQESRRVLRFFHPMVDRGPEGPYFLAARAMRMAE
jgi:hypothetical protein